MAPLGLSLSLDEGLVPKDVVETLITGRIASRLFAGDGSLWGAEAQPEAEVRLGWVDPAGAVNGPAVEELIVNIEGVRAELSEQGVDRIVLSGMGGSSLAPEVITRRYGVSLVVLDSTHPARVRRALGEDLSRTALVVSSKSGSTVETQSHRESFEAAYRAQGIDPAGRIIVVTDPGSPFEASARERGNRVFLADPNVGGRYSALTAFGLVPSGLAGADIRALMHEAVECRAMLASDSPDNPALRLAATLAAGLPQRFALVLAPGSDSATPRDHLAGAHDEAAVTDWGLPDWIEQLVAESTGKHGKGVLPVAVLAGAPETGAALPPTALLLSVSPLPAHATGNRLAGPLGAQFLCWEAATAVLGRLMSINPFDQPDVESAKEATREVLEHGAVEPPVLGSLTDIPGSALLRGVNGSMTAVELWLAKLAEVSADGYFALQAYLDSGSALADELDALREELAERLDVPVTFGWGPRFLHSTGQMHKGGPAVGVFLQLTDEAEPDLEIPGAPQTYRELLTAQAAGDAKVLRDRGRPVTTVRFTDPIAGVRALRAALGQVSEPSR